MKWQETSKCVRCFKPAKSHAGYVKTKDGKKVLAGWCSDKCRKDLGFVGHWCREMGRVRMEEK
jgi:hypothetical protein